MMARYQSYVTYVAIMAIHKIDGETITFNGLASKDPAVIVER